MMESLNALVAYYQATGLGLAEIVKRLALRIYNYPLGKFQAGEDDCGEFYLFFYPRLLRSISRFRDRGKPFEWYFNSILHWHYKVYCSRKRKDQTRWAAARNVLFWEFPDAYQSAFAPETFTNLPGTIIPLDRFGGSRESTCRKRILYLALKNAKQMDDSAIGWISELTGIEERRLLAMVENLRANLYKRELRLHTLYRRQNRIFTKIYLLQRDLQWEVDPEIKSGIAVSLCKLRTSLRSVQRRIRRVRLHPSNREIAELLQVPKGTVDTSLYWLRRRLSSAEPRQGGGESPQLCA
jgi:DNA-directed RNA polymerase specialized sigma24 family protein